MSTHADPAAPAAEVAKEKKPAAPKPAADGAAAPPADGSKPVKVDAKAERLKARLAEEEAQKKAKAEASAAAAAANAHLYGKPTMIRSTEYKKTTYTLISEINAALTDKDIVIRGRIHNCRKQGKNMCFLVIRSFNHTVQAVLATGAGLPVDMIAFASALNPETIVDVHATVSVPEKPVVSTTASGFELQVKKVFIISEAPAVLPFQLEDANRKAGMLNTDGTPMPTVALDNRLNCRWLDMRSRASNAVFKLQSRVGQYFRDYLLKNDFTEIHSPKLIGAASEGGANVFKLEYFGKPACLAQSPQLYKQMAIQGDIRRVFEVAPVFRAENSDTHRHMTEFIGLDVEMCIDSHYFEVLDLAEELFSYIFGHLASECSAELAAVNEQYPFDAFVHEVSDAKIDELGIGIIEENKPSTDKYGAQIRNRKLRSVRFPFSGVIQLLNDNPLVPSPAAIPGATAATMLTEPAAPLSDLEDIDTPSERKLGVLVKQRYGVDFYIVDRYPTSARPFYTMLCPDDERFSNSYDMFIRGEEIVSGAQRVHDPAMLEARAVSKGINPATLKDYIDSFRLGAYPHGGFGVGLERVVMLYMALKNIRLASMFPRDPFRCSP